MSQGRILTIALCFLSIASSAEAAFGNSEPSNSELLALIKTLQGRVDALESESNKYRDEVDAAQYVAKRALDQLAAYQPSRTEPLMPHQPMLLGSIKRDQPSLLSDSENSTANSYAPLGIVWGGSFGGGRTDGELSSREVYEAEQTRCAVGAGGAPECQLSTFKQRTLSKSGHDADGGAILDTFLGYNQQISRRIVAGVPRF